MYSITFKADGTCLFNYEPSTGANGTWELVTNTFNTSMKNLCALKIVPKEIGDDDAVLLPFFFKEGKFFQPRPEGDVIVMSKASSVGGDIAAELLSGTAVWYSWFGSVAFAADGTCKFAKTGADGTWEVVKNTFDFTKGEFALKIVRNAFPVVFGSGDAKIQEPAEISPFFLIEGRFVLMNKPEFILSKDA